MRTRPSFKVLDEPGKNAQSKSYMWLYRTSGKTQRPIIHFDYRASRAKKNPQDFLNGFSGFLHVDGYAGYESIEGVELAVGSIYVENPMRLLRL